MNSFIDKDVSLELRNQILLYQASFGLADTERAKILGLPEGCRMREGAKILYPNQLKMGRNCWIGENAVLDASGHLSIGSDTSIGLAVYIWTHDSHKVNLFGENLPKNNHLIKRKSTKIGNNCFIAGHTVIMPGVTIGNNCVVAPMSVVYKDLPDNTIYTPYRNMLKKMEKIDQLEKRLKELENAINKTL